MPRISVIFIRVVRKAQGTLDQRAFVEDIQTAIDPTKATTRYSRTWRFSRPRLEDSQSLMGKLGFVSVATETRTDYDDDLKDFVDQPQSTRQGHYAQWVLDLSSQVMAFEVKPPNIQVQSFVGALKGLLDEHPELALTAEFISESAKFYEWADTVDRITKFKAILRAPNPDFSSRPRLIRQLLEDTNADHGTVEVSKEAGSEESLRIKETALDDLVQYGEEGYSTIVAQGLKDGQAKIFDSRRKVATGREDIPDVFNVEEVWEALLRALGQFRR